jgi:D-alanine-D-alanine ligase
VKQKRKEAALRPKKKFTFEKIKIPMLKIAVMCGGYSGESVVSMRSAQMVMDHMDRSKYDPVQVVVEKERWYAIVDGKEVDFDRNSFSCYSEGPQLKFDGVFMMIHGTPGEDGLMQGYLDMMNIPYTTGDALNMAMTFNKKATTDFLRSHGFDVAKSVVIRGNLDEAKKQEILRLGFPFFVKPNCGGSSLGTSKVEDEQAMEAALASAMKVSKEVIVEEYLAGVEVTCGVIPWQGKITALPITEIVTQNAFFDFEAKYQGASQEITPARIPETVKDEIHKQAQRIYTLMRCGGMIRVDFIIREGVPHVVEVNTVPGFSAASIIPQQAAEMGIDKTALISAVMESAFAK